MSLEAALAANTAALEANTQAILKGGTAAASTAAAGKTAKAGKAETAAPASKHTREELAAALNSLKEAKGAPVAKALIKSVGGVDKLADVPEAKIDALFDAAGEKEVEEDDTM